MNESKQRHIALFVTSPYRTTEKEKKWIYPEQVEVPEKSRQTNETAIRYFQRYLELSKGQKLECAFALVTEEAKKDWNETDGELTKLMNAILGKEEGEKSRLKTVVLPKDGGLQGTFESACKLVDELQSYLTGDDKTKNSYDEMKNVTVHIDMTGGPRHDVMLLMALIQLLKSYGITIGKVVYGDLNKEKTGGKVEDVSPIMDMYTLISGVEEFRRYASAKILQEYFSANDWARASESLKTLVSEMQTFSESIKLCVKFEDVQTLLGRLNKSLNDYENHVKKTGNADGNEEKLFANLLSSISITYLKILNAKDDAAQQKIAIIRWCVTHGLLQQACTFYTEWFGSIVCSRLDIKDKLLAALKDFVKDKNFDEYTNLIRHHIPPKVRYKKPIIEKDLIDIKESIEKQGANENIANKLSFTAIKNQFKRKGSCPLAEQCFERVYDIQKQSVGAEDLILRVNKLEETDPIKIILKNAKNIANANFTQGQVDKYLKIKCYNNKLEFLSIFIDSFLSILDDNITLIFKIFNIKNELTEEQLQKVRELSLKEMFNIENLKEIRWKIVLKSDDSTDSLTRITEETIIKSVTDFYIPITGRFRNAMNHANYSVNGSQENLEKMILNSLEIFDRHL